MRLFTLFLGLSAFLSIGALYGQHKCGTTLEGTEEARARFMPGYFGCNYIKKTDKTLSITLWIAEDSLGSIGYNLTDLQEPMDFLNEIYEPIGIAFQFCDTIFMENFQFNDFVSEDELDEMLAMYYRPNTINLYLTQNVDHAPFGQVGGFAALPGGDDIIVMRKSTMVDQSQTLVHEMGHFFGLYHTFETEFGDEFVDGSNCEETGDLVCDTEADPNDEADNLPFPDCNYDGFPEIDDNGDYYVPPTNNFMSYFSNDCRCRFTPQQYNRMLEQYQQIRFYLW